MRITKISVTKLFGIFDHNVSMKKEKITIIHGPNGFGKTVLLRMVDGLFNNNFQVFYRVPFKVFRVELENKTTITVQKIKGDEPKVKISLISKDSDLEPVTVSSRLTRENEARLSRIDEIIPELTRVGPEEWRNIRTRQIFTLEEIIERYGDVVNIRGESRNPTLRAVFSLLNTHFIKTDRLRAIPSSESDRAFSTRRPQLEGVNAAVIEFAQDLSRKIRTTLSESAILSSSLDRSFPRRLVEANRSENKKQLSDTKIRTELAKLEEKRAQLTQAGLLDKDEENVQLPEGAVDEVTRLVLSIYARDVQEKLAVFDKDLQKIELFRAIVSKRFSYKDFKISKEKGFVFVSPDGTELNLTSLSSGEQHELVLLYELLFRVPKNALILLDEPEISLHISWQKEFLSDIESIINLTGFDVLLATHSPDIINDRWDLTVPLIGPDNK